jgi:hypothetical protein
MANIAKYTSGALAKTKKANEMIDKINSLLNMRFEVLDNPDATPEGTIQMQRQRLSIPTTMLCCVFLKAQAQRVIRKRL